MKQRVFLMQRALPTQQQQFDAESRTHRQHQSAKGSGRRGVIAILEQ